MKSGQIHLLLTFLPTTPFYSSRSPNHSSLINYFYLRFSHFFIFRKQYSICAYKVSFCNLFLKKIVNKNLNIQLYLKIKLQNYTLYIYTYLTCRTIFPKCKKMRETYIVTSQPHIDKIWYIYSVFKVKYYVMCTNKS